MDEATSVETKDLIATGELLRLSGMTPEELHHWVARELLPKPSLRYYTGAAGTRSYYPAWALDRASNIKRLRSHGVPMQHVRAMLGGEKVEK
jgi:DNA-binding transcriptional MerR regulator